MPYLSIPIHCVWSTKNRIPYLQNSHHRYELYTHIRKYAHSKEIFIDHIGGYIDHIYENGKLKSRQLKLFPPMFL